MDDTRLTRLIVVVIALMYLLLGVLFATRTPPWQAPDEPAHYNYIAQVAEGTLLPVIQAGDWDNAYLEQLKANRFAPELLDDLEMIRYENHQPPLYYWLSAPVYSLTGGDVVAVRLLSVLFGLVTVLLTYQIVLLLFPGMPQVALGAMALVAFLPQYVAIMASVNNDSLAGAVLAILLWQTVRYLRHESVPVWQMGVVMGLAMLTKTTIYFMGGVVVLAIVLRYWLDARLPEKTNRETIRQLLRDLLLFLVPAGLFALFWFGRNVLTYGFPDILGLRAHDVVVVGQLRTANRVAEIGSEAYLMDVWQTTWNSFRGQFGWMGVPMDAGVYAVMDIVTLIALSGVVVYLLMPRVRFQALPEATQRTTGLTLTSMVVLVLLMFVYYNTEFVQFQGRYLFGALIPVAMVATVGIETWRRLLLGRLAGSEWLTVAAFIWLAGLDVWLIWRVIPGSLTP